jgi:hypothetical protein
MLTPGFLYATAAFNLVCSTVATGNPSGTFKHENPAKFELRIDLDTMRWCGGEASECLSTLPIQEANESFIIIFNAKDGEGKARSSFTISRESGQFSIFERNESGDYLTTTNGVCKKAPFTGLPLRKF